MARIATKRATGMALTVVLLASCAGLEGSGGPVGNGFEGRYHNARSSLEAGNYGSAIRGYKAMIGNAGPLDSRLRLELAHAYLRADSYDDAIREATIVASAHADNRRAAALAVLGTAHHRLAQEAMSRGDFGQGTIYHLSRAKAALDEMLVSNADLDPLGSMAQRRDMAAASLRNLGRA